MSKKSIVRVMALLLLASPIPSYAGGIKLGGTIGKFIGSATNKIKKGAKQAERGTRKALKDAERAGNKFITEAPKNIGDGLSKMPKSAEGLISSIGKDLEKSSQKVGDIMADIVTGGENSRRRDKDRLRSAKKIAKLNEKSAEDTLEKGIETTIENIVELEASINILSRYKGNLLIVHGSLESNLEITEQLITAFKANEIEGGTIKNIINNQWSNLVKSLEILCENEPVNEESSCDLVSDYKGYIEQINKVPSFSDPEETNKIISMTLEGGLELIALLNETLKDIEFQISNLQDKLEKENNHLKNLKDNKGEA